MTNKSSSNTDFYSLNLFFKKSPDDITDDEVEYFRAHPDEIDEITTPLNVHKVFLAVGMFLGVCLVALSKLLKYTNFLAGIHEFVNEVLVDIVFEVGVALIGAAFTAYVLGILMNRQQELAAAWRVKIRRQIGE